MDVEWQWNPFGKHVRRMKIAGPILERKCICISDAWWEKKINKIWKFKKLLKTFKNIPFRGGLHLVSFLQLQVSFWYPYLPYRYLLNQNDMLIKQKNKPLLLIFLTYFEMQTCFRFMKLYSVELFIEKIWFMYRKGTKNLWIEKYFYFALSNICVFINKNVF